MSACPSPLDALPDPAPDLVLGASVGVADFGRDAIPTVGALLASAGSAMYAAKRATREERL